MKGAPDASLSFLDVLACALGGSSLLFLILTTLPHSGANAPKPSDAITASTVQVAPALAGAPAPAPPKLFRIELPSECRLSLENPEAESVVLGKGNKPTVSMRSEHWLRLGPDLEQKPVGQVTLKFEGCPHSEYLVIRAVRYHISLEPIVREIVSDKGRLEYNSESSDIWSLE
ncbi:hypothetical protein [Vibrio parahaemolyticus]|uniref:hypothetical protein n=1 Tax=Vibrio parahaemolyticus TaxID=670 RepID=UPI003299BECC